MNHATPTLASTAAPTSGSPAAGRPHPRRSTLPTPKPNRRRKACHLAPAAGTAHRPRARACGCGEARCTTQAFRTYRSGDDRSSGPRPSRSLGAEAACRSRHPGGEFLEDKAARHLALAGSRSRRADLRTPLETGRPWGWGLAVWARARPGEVESGEWHRKGWF